MSHDASFELASIPEKLRDQALHRFYAIRPFLEDGIPLTTVSRTTQIPLRTARRWVDQFRAQGLAGLLRQQRTSRRPSLPESMHQLIEALGLQSADRTVATIPFVESSGSLTKDSFH